MSGDESFPDVLTTPRLRLRRYSADDSQALHSLVEANRTHLIESFWKLSKGRNVHGADEEHDNLIYSRLSMTRRSPD